MKRSPHITFTLLFSASVVLGLSACTEGGRGEGADTTALNADTTLTNSQDRMGVAQPDSATAPTTISLLRQGVRNIALNKAMQNINGWQRRLQQQSGNPALAQINTTLDQLKTELQATQLDGPAVGDLLLQLGQQTNQAAQNVSGHHRQQLQQLGQVLSDAGRRLSGNGS